MAHLHQARSLRLPTREATLRRDPSVAQFWRTHASLLEQAWREWEVEEASELSQLDESLFHPALRAAIQAVWKDPDTEGNVVDLWQEVGPGVYQCPFFDPDRLHDLRAYLRAAAASRVPVRAPYGIVLNRRGAMLDPRSNGYLAPPSFQALYRDIIDRIMRPVSRLLFPEVTGHDTQSFGFSIHYKPNTDTSIRPHTDASATTLNINLNLPSETFEGSVVDFFDPKTGRTNELVFEPGLAVLHRGTVAHAARPITRGERTNFVLWLYGNDGSMPPRGPSGPSVDARTRWSVPSAPPDVWAPF